MQSQAIGLSRNASKARPICDLTKRSTTIIAKIATADTNQKYSVTLIGTPMSSGSVSLIPNGPSVNQSISLIRICAIVPKAKVTIAK